MQFCRFQLEGPREAARHPEPAGEARFGLLEGDRVREIEGLPGKEWNVTERLLSLEEIRLLAPVEPGKIVCVGRNFREHAAELGNAVLEEPLIFLKPPSAVIGPDQPIVLTPFSQRVEHEGELALVIGRHCAQLRDADDVRPYLFGCTCLNDVTARDIQKAEGSFTRAKSFDTFCPIGPVVETDLDFSDVPVETYVNAQRRQSGRTSQMIFRIEYLVRWISRMMTLEPGDVIATGTPAGVGPLAAGDSVEVIVGGIGTLRNAVRAPES